MTGAWLRALQASSRLSSAATAQATAVKASETLANVLHRGELVVGVKTDYAPFGMLNAQGQGMGLEHDLAADLAQRLGVRLVKVAVSGANRLQKLEEGTVDLVLATTGDTAERRRVATMIEPNYYSSGVTLFMRPEQRIKDWTEIRGKKVCVTQGSYFNRPMSQRYLLDLVTFNNARDARLAVRGGRCAGFLFDNTAIRSDLQLPEWAGYQAPLPPAMVVPWSLVLARKDSGTDFERWLGDTVADWHRSGRLVELERKWGLPPSKFLQETQALWLEKLPDGQAVCARVADGSWPNSCRNHALLTANDVDGLQRLGLWVRENYGVDLSLAYDAYDRKRFLSGLLWTLALMLLCMGASLSFGATSALVIEARVPIAAPLLRVLAIHGQMTPPLLQMYLVLFGLGSLAWTTLGISLAPSAVAVVCLGYYAGASIQGAILECCRHVREQKAGFQLRWSNFHQVVSLASPPVTASLVNIAKATMMASAISVPELLSASTSIMTDTGNVAVMMNALLLVFVVLISLTVRLLARLERWLQKTGKAPA